MVDERRRLVPDGTCIAYTQDARGASEIYTIRADGGDPRLVHRAIGSGELGSWSPDGSELLFHADSTESYDLYVMGSDGSDVRALTTTSEADEITPSWWAPLVPEPRTPECGEPDSEPLPGSPL
jgi:TolB protein